MNPDWVSLRATPETIAAMRAKADAMKSKHGYGFFDDDRFAGHLAELALAAWARSNRLPVVEHGGYDDLPDLEINGWGVGCKGRSIARRYLDDVWAIVTKEQADRPWDWWAFSAVVKEDPSEAYFMGAIPPDLMRDRADLVDIGNRGVPCLQLPVGCLTPPRLFTSCVALPK